MTIYYLIYFAVYIHGDKKTGVSSAGVFLSLIGFLDRSSSAHQPLPTFPSVPIHHSSPSLQFPSTTPTFPSVPIDPSPPSPQCPSTPPTPSICSRFNPGDGAFEILLLPENRHLPTPVAFDTLMVLISHVAESASIACVWECRFQTRITEVSMSFKACVVNSNSLLFVSGALAVYFHSCGPWAC